MIRVDNDTARTPLGPIDRRLWEMGKYCKSPSFNTRGCSFTIQLVFKIPSCIPRKGPKSTFLYLALSRKNEKAQQDNSICVPKCEDSERTGDGVAPMPLNQRHVDWWTICVYLSARILKGQVMESRPCRWIRRVDWWTTVSTANAELDICSLGLGFQVVT